MARQTGKQKRHIRKQSTAKESITKHAAAKKIEISQDFVPSSQRREQGKLLRDLVPRKDHAFWSPPSKRKDPIDVLEDSNRGRIPELIPIRYGRMMKSPFTFFRGSAALMAMDLAGTPVSGIKTQLCGDCHLLNFGAFATPERNVIIDINDFDETLPGPWEWDLKRLATSFVLACRANGFAADICREAAELSAHSYRTSMREFSEMTALDVWYSKMDSATFIAGMGNRELRELAGNALKKAQRNSIREHYFPKLTIQKNGRYLFKDNPPLVYHTEEQRELAFLNMARNVFEDYKATLNEARRVLLDRYTLMDVARKIVGIGSVGTYCAILLLMADENDPLILQVKEARSSVLEPYVGKSKHEQQGQRVVEGQRLMQSHSDIFLGWARGPRGRHMYIRQLKDIKVSLLPEVWTPTRALEVAKALGWVLARAHARAGDSALISGYLGSKDIFDNALADFAVAYADQAELDHKRLLTAVRSGRLEAIIER